MLPEKSDEQARTNHPGSDESHRSFHDRLVLRSQDYGVARKRAKQAKSTERGDRAGWAARSGRVLAELAIFTAGVALGAGVFRLRQGDPMTVKSVATIAIGLSLVAVTILARLWGHFRSRTPTQTARG